MNMRKLNLIFFWFAITIGSVTGNCQPTDLNGVKLLGYWKLQGDCKDYSGNGNHGINHNVDFSHKSHAWFNGINAYVEIPNTALFKTDLENFTISTWVKCEPGARVVGDIVNKYDADTRTGVNFHVFSSASGYSSVSDIRSVAFGIDNGLNGEWVDCGRPCATNSLISSLIVYKGNLYAGIGDALNPKDACRLFRYEGNNKWTDCGRVSKDLKTPSIMGTVIHKGKLYVGTGKWDYNEQSTGGRPGLYEYLGNNNWKECGLSDGKRIMSVASWAGSIYAPDDLGATYKYNDVIQKWTKVVGPSPYRYIQNSSMGSSIKFRCTGVFQDKLYGGAGDTIKRYDEKRGWIVVGSFNPKSINQIHTFAVYQGNFFAGTWPDGMITRYDGDGKWIDCGWVGSPETTDQNGYQSHKNEINDLMVYNGKMYAGVIPKAEVWRYDGGEKATLIKRLVNNEAFSIAEHESWCRVPSMAIYKGKLFAGTSTARGFAVKNLTIDAGKVFSWETGKCVSFDDDLGSVWRFVVAVREMGRLKLYVDGKLVAVSSPINSGTLNINNDKPLLIGFGAENYFKGAIKEIRIYSGALSQASIMRLYHLK
jgi:hypothetical protein